MPITEKFKKLLISEKCRVIYLEGEFIMAIQYYEYKINLYRLGDMLIEVFYSHKLDKIHKIELLDYSSSRMNFYIDQVNLNELLVPQEGM
jgi:hypothetical protein